MCTSSTIPRRARWSTPAVVVGGDVAVWFGELDEPQTEGQLRVRALDPELVWLAHVHEPWRPPASKAYAGALFSLLDSPPGGGSIVPSMKVETERMLSIGRFARLSGLTVKALRHYDEIGLLRPAYVDEWTGYRWYEQSQLREAVAVRRLRSLRVPLDMVAVLIQSDDESLREIGRASCRERV